MGAKTGLYETGVFGPGISYGERERDGSPDALPDGGQGHVRKGGF
jgi:hypothetical protein